VSIAQDLFAIDRALDREIDRLAAVFLGDLDGVTRRWQRAIARAIDRLDRNGAMLAKTAANVRAARASEGRVRQGLADSGFGDAAQHAFDDFGQVVKLSARALRKTGLTPTLREADADLLNTYRQLKLAEFERLADNYATRIGGVISKAVVAGQSAAELSLETQELLQTFANEARTLFETGAGEFAQTMTLLKGGTEARRVYLYSGPIDSRIRLFCLDVVGRVWSRSRIDKMDNRQLPNSFLTRGGYNCRHQWRDVTAIPDLARLADTKQYVDSVTQSQVAAMRGFLRIGGRQRGVRSA
jgi:hypothetical protein